VNFSQAQFSTSDNTSSEAVAAVGPTTDVPVAEEKNTRKTGDSKREEDTSSDPKKNTTHSPALVVKDSVAGDEAREDGATLNNEKDPSTADEYVAKTAHTTTEATTESNRANETDEAKSHGSRGKKEDEDEFESSVGAAVLAVESAAPNTSNSKNIAIAANEELSEEETQDILDLDTQPISNREADVSCRPLHVPATNEAVSTSDLATNTKTENTPLPSSKAAAKNVSPSPFADCAIAADSARVVSNTESSSDNLESKRLFNEGSVNAVDCRKRSIDSAAGSTISEDTVAEGGETKRARSEEGYYSAMEEELGSISQEEKLSFFTQPE